MYLRNTLGVIASELSGQVVAKVFMSPEQDAQLGETIRPLLSSPPVVSNIISDNAVGRQAIRALVSGSDRGLENLVVANNVDIVFESARWFGNRFPKPVVSWIPDFQHRRLPHLFSSATWWRRDIGLRIQTSGKRVIMLSSEDALADCVHFYPAAIGKTTVVHFALDVDPEPVFNRVAESRKALRLPSRFIYLPNQFWAHKNHEVVIRALKHLRCEKKLDRVMPILLTGRTEDPRAPALFKKLMGDVASNRLENKFIHLGLVPYEDVFTINAASDCLLNPSLFEGWSTTVEEAKALGTPMLLSDIAIHREQAPMANFFPPSSPEILAQKLLEISASSITQRPPTELLKAQQSMSRARHAQELLATFKKALIQLS